MPFFIPLSLLARVERDWYYSYYSRVCTLLLVRVKRSSEESAEGLSRPLGFGYSYSTLVVPKSTNVLYELVLE